MPLRVDRFKDMRQKRGYSQADLARLLNISQQQVNRWESGANDPSADAVARMARTFECTADWLLGLVERPHEQAKVRELSPDEYRLLALYREGKLPEMISRLVDELTTGKAQKNPVVEGLDQATVSGEDEPTDS